MRASTMRGSSLHQRDGGARRRAPTCACARASLPRRGRRRQALAGRRWPTPHGATRESRARALVNAGGPWVKDVRDTSATRPRGENVRHVKGSHIVVPRVHGEAHAYILQNADNRIVFVIPFEDRYSLIGTTDVAGRGDSRTPQITDDEIAYLLALANTLPRARRSARPTSCGPTAACGRSTTTARRDPSAITRDYVFRVDAGAAGETRGARAVDLRRQAHHVSQARRARAGRAAAVSSRRWGRRGRATQPLPGGDLPAGGLAAWTAELVRRYPALPADVLRDLAHRHGSRATAVLGRREDARPISARTSATASPRPRSTTSCARNGRAPPTTCCGGGPSAGSRCRRRRARASPRTSRAVAHRHARDRVTRPRRRRDASALRDARAARRAIRGVLTDIDDTLTTHGRLTARRLCGAGAAARRGQARDPDHRPSRRAGATTSRACGRSTRWSARTARSTCATTRSAQAAASASSPTTRRARAQSRAACRDRRAHPRGGAGLRARLRPALSRGRPRDRLPRGRAAAAARGGRSHRRADGSRRHDGQGELDPRQRLVRRATTS